jgi:hypothetical protein
LTERAPLARLLRTLLRSSSFLSSRKKKGKIVTADTSWISDRRRLLKTGTLMGLAAVTGSLAVGGVRVNAESHTDLKVPDDRMPDRAIGFMLPHEQFDVAELVEFGVAAEEAGFDFVATSDHFQPWQNNEGHAGMAWVTMAALARRQSGFGWVRPLLVRRIDTVQPWWRRDLRP